MDGDNELAKAKWLLIVGVLFLISCFMVYDEAAYALSGREAQATVAKAYESSGRRGGTRLTIEYTFAEPNGTQRKGMVETSPTTDLPRSGTMTVRYTPGEDGRSRPAGRVSWVWIGIFVASLLGVVVFAYRMKREADEAYRPSNKKR